MWHSILAALGWYLASVVPKDQLNDTIEKYNTYIVIGIVAIVVLVIAFFVVKHYSKKRKTASEVEQHEPVV